MELVTDAFSKAIYSTWIFSKPLRTLFDAGEGLVSALRNRCFAIERVFVTHGHYDHIGGIPGLVRIRGQGRGDKEKPFVIYYPEKDSGCELLQAYIARLVPNPSFHLEWVPVRSGTQIEISEKGRRKYIEAFPVEHMRNRLCLGYNVWETRERLKSTYASLSENEIATLAREKGRNEITETYEKKVMSYGGDGLAVDPGLIEGSSLLIHEATFLDDGERGKEIHATVSEVLATAKEARVSELLLMHFSTRYRASDIFKALRAAVQSSGLDIPVHVLLSGRISTLEMDRNGSD
jgi:ribonuclease Z